jgi:MYXO-CTERM domain-containing protein
VGCDKKCDVELPSASCDVQCKASCDGSCEVQPNIDCQVDCQAKGYARCEADVTGGCMVSCDTQQGALFCDGQFIDTDKLDECVAALKAILNAKVDASASGRSDCTGGTCNAAGKASVSSDCTVAHAGSGGTRAGLYGVLGLMGVGLVLRRRRHSSRG